jgi:hypothetical protein
MSKTVHREIADIRRIVHRYESERSIAPFTAVAFRKQQYLIRNHQLDYLDYVKGALRK